MKPAVVDTNVLVRLATGDHAGQHRAAVESLAARIWRVLPTVVLETEWTLRSRYDYAPEQFAQFVDWLDAHPRIDLAQADSVRAAVACHRAGMDFADALHLAQADDAPFLTLDRALRRKADALGLHTEALI
ncbi:MAG: type II toxin-antitoxin system VapC family toxin [Betaproteobacteria bacterium]|nr:type II toxin-antitoxin system VapC family toxin [Betaproteobacteria bacterium]MCL2886181.1 type II toxin-antitoxin system VapC family toxin [Betaproteobacteria bacterium]